MYFIRAKSVYRNLNLVEQNEKNRNMKTDPALYLSKFVLVFLVVIESVEKLFYCHQDAKVEFDKKLKNTSKRTIAWPFDTLWDFI